MCELNKPNYLKYNLSSIDYIFHSQAPDEEEVPTIKCYNCEFSGCNVHDIYKHHKKAHIGEKFLWTELKRGFTCDRTGEALPGSENVPSANDDVGYSTKMTLGAGNQAMR